MGELIKSDLDKTIEDIRKESYQHGRTDKTNEIISIITANMDMTMVSLLKYLNDTK